MNEKSVVGGSVAEETIHKKFEIDSLIVKWKRIEKLQQGSCSGDSLFYVSVMVIIRKFMVLVLMHWT